MSNDDVVDEPEDHSLPWEDDAEDAVKEALENASVDDVRGVVTFGSGLGHQFDHECAKWDDLIHYLEEIYDQAWYANVPFEGGEAVFESDSPGNVGDLLADTEFEEFFVEIREPDDAKPIITARELVRTPAESGILRVEFRDIEKELVEYFAKHPEKLREIDPYDFEKLMAAIFKNRGFDVQLTPKSKDGGVDLMLLKRSDLGAAMTLVDCKRYAAHNKVGVEVVRGLYGVVERERATSGLIVTTSYFTSGAVAERERLKYRMGLADYDNVQQFLKDWRA